MTLTPSFQALRDRIWRPTVDPATVMASYGIELQPKQALADRLSAEVDELLFGGAVGGGKSHWLLAHFVAEMERHPGNRGLILRRTMPRLKRSLLPRAEALLAGRATANRNDSTFTWPNGSVLEFGHVEHEHSVHNYQGAEYGVIGFEEVTEFLESQWEFLSTRLRAPVDGVRPHMVGTTNPGGVGHRWVKARWVKPPAETVHDGDPGPGAMWRAVPKVHGQQPPKRVFVPSTLDDNPALIARDPGYRDRMLASISNRALREALASGDWDAIDQIEGALWDWAWIEPHRVESSWTGDTHTGSGGLARIVVAVDPAASAKPGSDETGIVVAGKGYDGRGYVLADRSCRATPDGWGKRTVAAYREFAADIVVVERNNGGDMVVPVVTNIDGTIPVRTVWAARGKRTRAEPVAALYEDGRISHVGAFPDLEEQLTTWVPDDGDSPDRLDALVWALSELFVGGSTPAAEYEYEVDALGGSR